MKKVSGSFSGKGQRNDGEKNTKTELKLRKLLWKQHESLQFQEATLILYNFRAKQFLFCAVHQKNCKS